MPYKPAFVHISVDGARDTPQRLRAYLDNFDPETVARAIAWYVEHAVKE